MSRLHPSRGEPAPFRETNDARASAGPRLLTSGRPWRALVAEDSPVSQRVAAAQLRRLGGEVDVVASGAEAIEAVAARNYDIVFMDCCMPDVDGLEATREIRRREGPGRRTPIVAVTANTVHGNRDRCRAAGMDDYLPKPVRSRELRHAIARHVSRAGLENAEAPSPLSPTGPLPVVDRDALRQLKALDADGTPGFLAELARDFDRGFQERLEELQTAMRTGDSALMESAAHSLKGSAGLLGATTLGEKCRQLERLAQRDAPAEGVALVAGLTRERSAVISAIEAVVPPSRARVPDGSPPGAPAPGPSTTRTAGPEPDPSSLDRLGPLYDPGRDSRSGPGSVPGLAPDQHEARG